MIRLLKDKRAAIDDVIEFIPYLILSIIVMSGVYLVVSLGSNPSFDTAPVQANTFIYRTIYSPNSISYVDSVTKRVYPGIINDDNFNSKFLDASLKYNYEKQLAAKFELIDSKNENLIKTAYYNELWFNRLVILGESDISGFGSARAYYKTIPVIYRQNNADVPAFLRVTVVIPN